MKRCCESFIRIACDRIGMDDPDAVVHGNAALFQNDGDHPYFRITNAGRCFLDLVFLEAESELEPYENSRALNEAEWNKYESFIHKLVPDVERNHLRRIDRVRAKEDRESGIYLPFTLKTIPVDDPFLLQNDTGFIELMKREENKLGKAGKVFVRFTGVGPAAKIFAEGGTEELCVNAVNAAEAYLIAENRSEGIPEEIDMEQEHVMDECVSVLQIRITGERAVRFLEDNRDLIGELTADSTEMEADGNVCRITAADSEMPLAEAPEDFESFRDLFPSVIGMSAEEIEPGFFESIEAVEWESFLEADRSEEKTVLERKCFSWRRQ